MATKWAASGLADLAGGAVANAVNTAQGTGATGLGAGLTALLGINQPGGLLGTGLLSGAGGAGAATQAAAISANTTALGASTTAIAALTAALTGTAAATTTGAGASLAGGAATAGAVRPLAVVGCSPGSAGYSASRAAASCRRRRAAGRCPTSPAGYRRCCMRARWCCRRTSRKACKG